jgi:hypothetical protein
VIYGWRTRSCLADALAAIRTSYNGLWQEAGTWQSGTS